MSLHRSGHRAHRHAVRLALVAMLLLLAGPIIGQLSAFGESGLGHHAGASMAHAADESIRAAPHRAKAASWHDQCGYCPLFQHCPVIAVALPKAARAPVPATAQPATATSAAHGSLATFPHALTRAPPSRVMASSGTSSA